MDEAWAGTSRFQVLRRLGAGASGTVYEVLDRKLDAIVALKALSRPDPTGLYLFKQEFRELADMHHPHLVKLYELEEDSGRWFSTMELVRGEDFVAHVRPGDEPRLPAEAPSEPLTDATETSTVIPGPGGDGEAPADASRVPDGVALDPEGIARLRAAMSQLAEASSRCTARASCTAI